VTSADTRTRLLELLNAGHEPTFEDLRRLLGVQSDRHMRRLIGQLRESGVPLVERRVGRHKRFFIPEEQRQLEARPLTLTEDQVFALTVAAEAARSMLEPTPLGEPLREAFSELLSNLSSQVHTFEPESLRRHWHFGTTPTVAIDPAMFRTISRAVEECRRIRIDYLTASTGSFTKGRLVDPLAVAVQGGTWLLVAYCHMRQRVVDFALAGIQRLEMLDPDTEPAYFSRPDSFDAELHFRDRFGALSGDEVHEVRIRVEASKAEYFRRKNYHPTQQIEATEEDGKIVVSFEVAGLTEIRSFLLSWGAGITVLEPAELVVQMREEAQAIAERYASDVVAG
jgi:predicted DNA-binding transcriptional regulator YafY